MSRSSRIPVLVFDGDPWVIEDFRIVLDPPHPTGENPGSMGIAFEAGLLGSRPARDRFPDVELTFERNGHATIEAVRQAVERGQSFRVAFIDIGVPPGNWGLDIAATLRALDPKLHIVLTIAEPGPRPVDICERIPPADRLSLLHKPARAHEIEQLVLAAATRYARERADELTRAQARDIAAKALTELPLGLIVAEQDRRIVVATGAVSIIFPEYRGGLVPGAYLPERLSWITGSRSVGPGAWETQSSGVVRELRLDDGRCVVAASAPSSDGGGISLFLDVTDQKRQEIQQGRHAQAVQLAKKLTAFRNGVNALLRENARPRGRAAPSSRAKFGTGDRSLAKHLQELIRTLDAAIVAPVESDG